MASPPRDEPGDPHVAAIRAALSLSGNDSTWQPEMVWRTVDRAKPPRAGRERLFLGTSSSRCTSILLTKHPLKRWGLTSRLLPGFFEKRQMPVWRCSRTSPRHGRCGPRVAPVLRLVCLRGAADPAAGRLACGRRARSRWVWHDGSAAAWDQCADRAAVVRCGIPGRGSVPAGAGSLPEACIALLAATSEMIVSSSVGTRRDSCAWRAGGPARQAATASDPTALTKRAAGSASPVFRRPPVTDSGSNAPETATRENL